MFRARSALVRKTLLGTGLVLAVFVTACTAQVVDTQEEAERTSETRSSVASDTSDGADAPDPSGCKDDRKAVEDPEPNPWAPTRGGTQEDPEPNPWRPKPAPSAPASSDTGKH